MRGAHGRYPQHGPRRRWFRPWRRICWCGLDAYPCTTMRMRADLARVRPVKGVASVWTGVPAHLDRPFTAPADYRPLLTRGQAARANRRPR